MLFMVSHREPVLDMINCKPSLSPNNLIFITFLNVFSGRSIGLPVTPRDVKWLFKFIFFLLSGQFSGCLRARLRILRVQQFASIGQKDSAVMADGQITYTSTAKMDEKSLATCVPETGQLYPTNSWITAAFCRLLWIPFVRDVL